MSVQRNSSSAFNPSQPGEQWAAVRAPGRHFGVKCPRTLWHVDSRSRDSNRRASDHWSRRPTTELQPPLDNFIIEHSQGPERRRKRCQEQTYDWQTITSWGGSKGHMTSGYGAWGVMCCCQTNHKSRFLRHAGNAQTGHPSICFKPKSRAWFHP